MQTGAAAKLPDQTPKERVNVDARTHKKEKGGRGLKNFSAGLGDREKKKGREE